MKPGNLSEFKDTVLKNRAMLTARQLEAADFALNHPNDLAFNSLTEISKLSGIATAMFVRLAQALEFKGFSEMQKIFREPLIEKSTPSYSERIRHCQGEEHLSDPNNGGALIDSFARANKISLDYLRENSEELELDKAIDLILAAPSISILGLRRSFPLATYLSYALYRFKIANTLITGLAGFAEDQLDLMQAGDLLIVMSFPPYAEATVEFCAKARAAGVRILAITDDPLGIIAHEAEQIIEVHDAVLHGFRSLTASMCIVQSLAIGIGYRKRLNGEEILLDEIDC